MTDGELDEVIASADTNKDNLVSIEEFVGHFMQSGYQQDNKIKETRIKSTLHSLATSKKFRDKFMALSDVEIFDQVDREIKEDVTQKFLQKYQSHALNPKRPDDKEGVNYNVVARLENAKPQQSFLKPHLMKNGCHELCEESFNSIKKNLVYDKKLIKHNPFFLKKKIKIPEVKYKESDLL